MTESTETTLSGERADLVRMLDDQRHNFLITVRGLNDDQARAKPSASDLTLGGLVSHVMDTERHWIKTIAEPDENAEFDMEGAAEQYIMSDGDTLAVLLERYAEVARATSQFIAQIPDLDVLVPLPTAPWSPQRQWWSARYILLHVIRETAQHAGHADIIRESLDGASTTMQMGADAGMEF
ncbi:uncharacterized protein DUF664 [Antricoccus suffuscus]|uniref:Uncharacterized protein DUF664 n=1 Tax=Antricoccus suffuscus TaxID=1629062 RepID=A0A2T0ZW48_9ACTN|nr:DinB family protein [Antricoccus suffuscus]PRZ40514.1 uncharacterized protein DUF664 [Antricoccus suffuscus]